MRKFFLAFDIILPIAFGTPLYIYTQTKAFPTAKGFGCMSSGRRGGQLVKVITLKNNTSPRIGFIPKIKGIQDDIPTLNRITIKQNDLPLINQLATWLAQVKFRTTSFQRQKKNKSNLEIES